MTKDLWINLPVKDVGRARAFFGALGLRFKEPNPAGPGSACMLVGAKPIVVMLFEEPQFQGFARHPVADTARGAEVLLSIDAENREEVDALAEKAAAAGGHVFAAPGGQGPMYGCGFSDPDGHRWNVLYMAPQ